MWQKVFYINTITKYFFVASTLGLVAALFGLKHYRPSARASKGILLVYKKPYRRARIRPSARSKYLVYN